MSTTNKGLSKTPNEWLSNFGGKSFDYFIEEYDWDNSLIIEMEGQKNFMFKKFVSFVERIQEKIITKDSDGNNKVINSCEQYWSNLSLHQLIELLKVNKYVIKIVPEHLSYRDLLEMKREIDEVLFAYNFHMHGEFFEGYKDFKGYDEKIDEIRKYNGDDVKDEIIEENEDFNYLDETDEDIVDQIIENEDYEDIVEEEDKKK